MDLRIPYGKVTNKEEAYSVVKKNITPQTMERFKVKAELDYNDQARCIMAKGPGFTMNLTFEDSQACIKLDLSLLLRPLKNKVLQTLEKQLKSVI